MRAKQVDLDQQWQELKKSIIRLILAFFHYLWVVGLGKWLAKFAYLILDWVQPTKRKVKPA